MAHTATALFFGIAAALPTPMNKPASPPSKSSGMPQVMISRRQFALGAVTGLGSTLLGVRPAWAGVLGIQLNTREGVAVAAAIAGTAATVEVDARLGPTAMAIGGTEVDVGRGILLKGKGQARARFLDDARNASKLAARIRDALTEADPGNRDLYIANHKSWSRTFGRKVLAWELALKKSPLRGKTVADPHGRIYLLEWAGATVAAGASDKGPAGLERLPAGAARPSPEGYTEYVAKLVAAVS